MLKKNNAKKIKIPYKENRAVIFNSQLFKKKLVLNSHCLAIDQQRFYEKTYEC